MKSKWCKISGISMIIIALIIAIPASYILIKELIAGDESIIVVAIPFLIFAIINFLVGILFLKIPKNEHNRLIKTSNRISIAMIFIFITFTSLIFIPYPRPSGISFYIIIISPIMALLSLITLVLLIINRRKGIRTFSPSTISKQLQQ